MSIPTSSNGGVSPKPLIEFHQSKYDDNKFTTGWKSKWGGLWQEKVQISRTPDKITITLATRNIFERFLHFVLGTREGSFATKTLPFKLSLSEKFLNQNLNEKSTPTKIYESAQDIFGSKKRELATTAPTVAASAKAKAASPSTDAPYSLLLKTDGSEASVQLQVIPRYDDTTMVGSRSEESSSSLSLEGAGDESEVDAEHDDSDRQLADEVLAQSDVVSRYVASLTLDTPPEVLLPSPPPLPTIPLSIPPQYSPPPPPPLPPIPQQQQQQKGRVEFLPETQPETIFHSLQLEDTDDEQTVADDEQIVDIEQDDIAEHQESESPVPSEALPQVTATLTPDVLLEAAPPFLPFEGGAVEPDVGEEQAGSSEQPSAEVLVESNDSSQENATLALDIQSEAPQSPPSPPPLIPQQQQQQGSEVSLHETQPEAIFHSQQLEDADDEQTVDVEEEEEDIIELEGEGVQEGGTREQFAEVPVPTVETPANEENVQSSCTNKPAVIRQINQMKPQTFGLSRKIMACALGVLYFAGGVPNLHTEPSVERSIVPVNDFTPDFRANVTHSTALVSFRELISEKSLSIPIDEGFNVTFQNRLPEPVAVTVMYALQPGHEDYAKNLLKESLQHHNSLAHQVALKFLIHEDSKQQLLGDKNALSKAVLDLRTCNYLAAPNVARSYLNYQLSQGNSTLANKLVKKSLKAKHKTATDFAIISEAVDKNMLNKDNTTQAIYALRNQAQKNVFSAVSNFFTGSKQALTSSQSEQDAVTDSIHNQRNQARQKVINTITNFFSGWG